MNSNSLGSLPILFSTKNNKNSLASEFEKQRSNRAFELRRTLLMNFQRSKTYRSRLSDITNEQNHFVYEANELSNEDTVRQAIKLIKSNDDQKIYQFITFFNKTIEQNDVKARYLFDKVIRSEEFIEIIIEAINDADNSEDTFNSGKVKIALFDVISMTYSLSAQEYRTNYIDSGLCFSLLNTLSKENGNDILNYLVLLNKPHDQKLENHFLNTLSLFSATYNLIAKLVELSVYARDSILSLGIHDIICDIIEGIYGFFIQNSEFPRESELFQSTIEIMVQSSFCLQAIFDNPKDIDRKTVLDFVPKLVRLLRIDNYKVSYNIIKILLYIVRILQSTVYKVFEFEDGEIKQHILRILTCQFENADQIDVKEKEDLIEITLKFLGNLCRSKPSDVQTLYSAGIIDILHGLMQSPRLITEVFWVLSNLYEVLTDQMIKIITPEFIKEIVNYAKNGSFNCKLDTGYFFATIIVFSPQSVLNTFIQQDIVDIVVEVLGCGLPNSPNFPIVQRSVNAIARLVHYAQIVNEMEPLLSFLEASDLQGRLRELLDVDKMSVWLDSSVEIDEFYRIICDLSNA